MLTLLLLVTLTTPPQAPCLPQSMLPVVDDTPRVQPAPEVVYRIGSLPPTWVPPSPPVYSPPVFMQSLYTPTYTPSVVTGYDPPAYCMPGQR